ncbi:hypothetical protein LINGRAPRIM_LOCUS1006 [Linum grandiflorum]
MGKSIRSKREKRLRAIRRDLVTPHYDKKDEAKIAALEAALAAPKLEVRPSPFAAASAMDTSTVNIIDTTTTTSSEFGVFGCGSVSDAVEMAVDGNGEKSMKPLGRKLRKKLKLSKNKRRGKKGNIKKRR